MVVVPLYDTLGAEAIVFIINQGICSHWFIAVHWGLDGSSSLQWNLQFCSVIQWVLLISSVISVIQEDSSESTAVQWFPVVSIDKGGQVNKKIERLVNYDL